MKNLTTVFCVLLLLVFFGLACPTLLSGKAVKVRGIIVYNFVP